MCILFVENLYTNAPLFSHDVKCMLYFGFYFRIPEIKDSPGKVHPG